MKFCFTICIIFIVLNSACIDDFGNKDSSPSLIREIRDTSTAKRQDNKIKNKKRKKQRKSGKRKRLKYQGNSNSENSNETKKKKITGRKKTNTGVAKSKTQKKKSKNKKRNGQKKSERHQKGGKISKKSKKEKKRSKKNRNGKKVRKYSRKAKDKKKKEKKKTNKNHSSQAKINKVHIKRLDNSSLDSNTTDLRKKLTCDCDQPNKAAVKYFTQNRRFYDKYNFLEKKLDKISVFKSYASLLGKITKNGTVCTKAARVRRFVILHDTFCGSNRSPRCLLREHLLEH